MRNILNRILKLVKRYQLDDVRTIGLLIFAFIVLAVTWSGARAVQLNYVLQKRVATIEQENQVFELENQTQKLKNDYYQTDEFKELEARRVLGRAAPGERVFVVPKEVALSKVSLPEEPKIPTNVELPPVEKSKSQQNFEDWMDFFLGRSL